MATITGEISLSSTLRDKLAEIQPCYLFDSKKFKKNIAEYSEAFRKEFPKFALAYSTKTDAAPLILKALRESDADIEIVSSDELELAMKSLFLPNEIVYNGVVPDRRNKMFIAYLGGKVNVESYNELKDIHDMAVEQNYRIEVGIRLNIDIEPTRTWKSRFGVVPFSDEWNKCIELQDENMQIVGLHCHIHGCRTLEHWQRRAEIMGKVGKTINAKYLDFGSNLFGFMDERLKNQFDVHVPTASEYAKTIKKELVKYFDELPEIIIEAGTPVVADTVSVVGKIENVHERGFDTIATASCSVYDFGFFHGSDKHPPMDIVHVSEGEFHENVEIFGYACTEDDTVLGSYTGNIAVGDLVLFRNLGAYAYSLSSDFIKKKMPMYDVNKLL